MSFSQCPGELNDALHTFHLSLNLFIKVFIFHFREAQKVDRSWIVVCVYTFRDINSQPLIDAFSKEWGIRRLNENGVNEIRDQGCAILLENQLTIVRHRVNKVSNSVFRADTVSSWPSSPLSRFRLKRIYQLVSSSTRSKRRGTMVYSRYATIGDTCQR